MKNYLITVVIFLFSLISFQLFAQDVITMKNGNEVVCNVTATTKWEVTYKTDTSISAPVKTVLKSEIFMIKYSNGTKEVYNNQQAPVQSNQITNNNTTPVQSNQTTNNYPTSVQQQVVDYSLAKAKRYNNNKPVFYNNQPSNAYDIAFTFEDHIPNYDCLSLPYICNYVYENCNKEAVAQGRPYDAIIMTNGAPRDLAIIFKPTTNDVATATVTKTLGKFVFLMSEPNAMYDVVEQYAVTGWGQQAFVGTCPTLQERIEKAIKKAIKDKLDFDGLIIGETTKIVIIKFK
jgi:hypothetical protein